MGRERTTLEKSYDRLTYEQFLYINKVCIINIKQVISLKNEMVVLDNNIEHVVSRLMASRVRKELTKYWGEWNGEGILWMLWRRKRGGRYDM